MSTRLLDAVTVHHGDCIEVLRGLPSGSVDSIVTDPPYGIRFMGQAWDGADIARRTQQGLDSSKAAPKGARGPHGGYRSASVEAGRYSRSRRDSWAFQQWCEEWACEALRVLKPGTPPREWRRPPAGRRSNLPAHQDRH